MCHGNRKLSSTRTLFSVCGVLEPLRLKTQSFMRVEMLASVLSNCDLLLTCVNEDGIHIDFGTERAQNKSTGWSKYQHREQDSYKKKKKG